MNIGRYIVFNGLYSVMISTPIFYYGLLGEINPITIICGICGLWGFWITCDKLMKLGEVNK